MIKGTLNSPLLDVAVNSTITPDDDKILNELRTVLIFASKELGIVTDGLVNGNTISLLNDIKTHLNKLTESNKNAILQAIAVIVLKQLETEITTAEANLFISAKYVEKKL